MSWEGFGLLLVLLELWRRWRWWIGFGFDLGFLLFCVGQVICRTTEGYVICGAGGGYAICGAGGGGGWLVVA
jgi:hypothetical protein